jgi:hypothetical protein
MTGALSGAAIAPVVDGDVGAAVSKTGGGDGSGFEGRAGGLTIFGLLDAATCWGPEQAAKRNDKTVTKSVSRKTWLTLESVPLPDGAQTAFF